MRVRGVLGVAVVAAVLVAAGCTPDEPDPTTTSSGPTSSAATTEPTTSTPTFAVPELPEAATVGDAAGAETFVKHWVDVLNYAYATGDTQSLVAISDPGCEVCESLISVIDERVREGKVLEGGLAVVDLVRSPPPESGLVSVSAQLGQQAGRVVAADGVAEELTGDPPANVGFVALFEAGAWRLGGVGPE